MRLPYYAPVAQSNGFTVSESDMTGLMLWKTMSAVTVMAITDATYTPGLLRYLRSWNGAEFKDAPITTSMPSRSLHSQLPNQPQTDAPHGEGSMPFSSKMYS